MSNFSIEINNISKMYAMYNNPKDRFKESLSISHKLYHTEFWAAKDINLNIEKGEIVGIMGRNGAGKSTLLKMITGVLTPTTGNIVTNGRISSLLELGAGFNLEYSGIDNIYFYCTLMGLSKKEIDQRLDDIVDFTEIGDYIYQPVKTYSSGMFARLAFSCAIKVDPEILIVDEILSVGDLRFQSKCFKKFKEFKRQGVTIIYVGHDIGTMRNFCDRCVWMNNGKIVSIGDPTYISAKFTEFMYLEDITKFTNYEKLDEKAVEEKTKDKLGEETPDINQEISVTTDKDIESCFKTGAPLSHWGTNVGIVKSFEILTEDGKPLISCSPYEKVSLSITLDNTLDVDFENLSVAFSIKNKEGTDLLVSTTYGQDIKFTKSDENINVSFSFETRLTNGDYYLVLAIEDRKEVVTSYYEYIEGATYFKCYENKGLYGVFLTDVVIDIK